METTDYLAPYIRFQGKCREAMAFYLEAFGGDLSMTSFEEAGVIEAPHPEYIMHAQLITPEGMTFMGTDGAGEPVSYGTSISLAIVTEDHDRGHILFDALSEGGEIDVELEKQMWGAEFGAVVDKFGVNWMFNISPNE
ncbi:VOC family protein [Stomatohabitans albus]|uniref:VOC family protein n=1 Tax=Stomatohabitans albus TaxID=3110766 RepID=UPI00300C45DF